MNIKNILAALALGVAASSASATVLNFDNLTEMVYGDTAPLAASMAYEGLNLAYVESGFRVVLHAPEAAPGVAHIGDGSYMPQTFNWHDGFDNGASTYVTVSRVGGGLFNLIGFDYFTDAMALLADGSTVALLEGEGIWSTALNGITELRFTSGAFNQLDNIQLEEAQELPLPATPALLMGGLAAAVLARRRKR